jgi:hypothetical protein
MSVRTLSRALAVGVMVFASPPAEALSSTALSAGDVEECNRLAQTKLNPLSPEADPSTPAPRRGARRKPSPPPAIVSPDPADASLRGMHEVGYKNEYYRKAYRDCMKDRGASDGKASRE